MQLKQLCAAAMLLGTATAGVAAARLDQQDAATSANARSPFEDEYRINGQTFTAGLSGLMTRVDILIRPDTGPADSFGDLRVYATAGGVPTTLLHTGSFTALSGITASFATSFYVTEGTSYAIVPVHVAGNGAWRTDPLNTYARGSAVVYQKDVASWIAVNEIDFNFSTYVDTAVGPPVPEPASWALMLAGFGTAGVALRRRRRVRAAA